ncbi:hypothetical protein KBT16_16700 [Nostoc sp. CCCryo 231-06]|nr:hypothetical protein [Nostoc sp. CCCryo 231-06]
MDILIVEDEPEIAHLIELSLEKEGFFCRISRDGMNALRMFQEQPPDLKLWLGLAINLKIL